MNVPGVLAHVRAIQTGCCLPMVNKRGGRGFVSMAMCVCVPYLSDRRVCATVQLGEALVSQVVKDVEGTHRLWASLLVAENKVNPLMQLT